MGRWDLNFSCRQQLRIWVTILALLLVSVITAVHGRADAESDCTQGADVDRLIRGCSEIIARARPPSGGGFLNPSFFTSPKVASAYHNRGYAYTQKGDYGRALSDLDEAIKLNPNIAVAYRNRAEVYLAYGRSSQALADVERALALNPSLGIGFATRAKILEKNGRRDEAARDFRRACEIGEPKDACANALRFPSDEQTRDRLAKTAKDADRQRLAQEFGATLTSCREGSLADCDRAERLASTPEERQTVAEVRLLGTARARILERQRKDPQAAEAAWRERFKKMLDDDERAHKQRRDSKP